jgi:5-(aminomethyl)-3-furanmethanol phosphate kinase
MAADAAAGVGHDQEERLTLAVFASGPRPFVIKVGGSLGYGDQLVPWLDAIRHGCDTGRQNKIVLVPGGGAFADTVRKMQPQMHFDDDAAHHMALLAMEQYGLALTALWPRLVRAETVFAMRRAWRARAIPCWAPTRMVLAAAALAKSWKMTSDSLAAWLAYEIGAARVLLIKSADADTEPLAGDLVASGVVDPLFGDFAARSGAEIFIAGPAALTDAGALLARGGTPGLHVRFS